MKRIYKYNYYNFENSKVKLLKNIINREKINLIDFLNISINMCKIIEDFHRKKIIYKKINPYNIIINVETYEVQIIINTDLINENLNYISPEQTGRINCNIDYGTDLYSLGAIFYEMITGQVPFKCNDALELIYNHIAKIPILPKEINKDIPQVISNIIMKLLSKNKKDRYKSAYGLKFDLEECRKQLENTKKIENFPLAQRDISDKFKVSKKLYGREKELKKLLNIFEEVKNNESQLVFISGEAGIGKTALIDEFKKSILDKEVYFICGKFDKHNKNIPYSAFIEGFNELINYILMESEENIKKWKHKLINVLGENCKVITDIIPEFKLIIDEEFRTGSLHNEEEKDRFNILIKNFIKIFTENCNAFVIFLDDLHWAGATSLKLIYFLLNNINKKLLIITTSRSESKEKLEAMNNVLNVLQNSQVKVNNMELFTLKLKDIQNLLSDTFNCEKYKTKSLAEVVLDQTKGNPLFLKQFLNSLNEDKIIEFDYNEVRWKWNTNLIQITKYSNSLTNLIVKKITNISFTAKKVLKLSACIGNKFDVNLLSKICKGYHINPKKYIYEIENQGLIVYEKDNYYVFSHDNIRIIVLNLIPKKSKEKIHLNIGRNILNNVNSKKLDDKRFEIVNHFNFGINFINEEEEKLKLIYLNLWCSRSSKSSTAYIEALEYLKIAKSMLCEDCWKNQYKLTMYVYMELIKCEYLLQNFEKVEELINIVLKYAKSEIEKANVYNINIVKCINRFKVCEAINLSKEILKIFDIEFSNSKEILRINNEKKIKELYYRFKDYNIEYLINRPILKNFKYKVIINILWNMWTACYISRKEDLSIAIILKIIDISIKYGNGQESIFAYMLFSYLVNNIFCDNDLVCKLNLLCVKLNSKINRNHCKFNYLFSIFINYWTKNTKISLTYLKKAYQEGIKTGDLIYTSFITFKLPYIRLILGENLNKIFLESKKYLSYFKNKNMNLFTIQLIINKAILCFMNKKDKDYILSNNIFYENDIINNWESINLIPLIENYKVIKLMILYMFGYYNDSLKYAEELKDIYKYRFPKIISIEYYFYYTLTLTAIFNQVEEDKKKIYLDIIEKNEKIIKKYTYNSKKSFYYKYLLIEAEKARILNKDLEAMEFYDKVIEYCCNNNFMLALSNELAGKYYLNKGRSKIGKTYILDSIYGYNKWGALAKVDNLKCKYEKIFSKVTINRLLDFKKEIDLESIDLKYVIKASQIISNEIELKGLLKKLIQIIIRNSGSEKVYIIRQEEDNLVIEGKGSLKDKNIDIFCNIPIENCEEICKAIIYYVARTKKDVILNDASNKGMFILDNYIKRNKSKSILCMPIMYQGNIKAILYLKNDLITNMFTSETINVLKILASQAAISIENALMYKKIKQLNSNLEKKVKMRTKELNNMVIKLQNEIQEREIIEQALKENQERLRTFINSIPDCVCFKDGQGRWIEANEAYINVANLKSIDYKGKTNTEIARENNFFKNLFLSFERKDEKIWERGSVLRKEDIIYRPDGKKIIFDSIKMPLFYDDGKRKGLLIISRNITNYKKSQLALKESEKRYRTLVELFPDAIYISDLNKNIFLNSNAFKLLEIENIEEIKNKCLIDFIHPDYKQISKKRMDLLLKENKVVPLNEEKIITHNGDIIDVEVLSTTFSYKNKKAILTVVRDITERKRAEKLNEKVNEMLEYDKLKTEFFANISHELKTPINVIFSALQMCNLMINSISSLEEKNKFNKYVNIMKQNSYRLIRLINNIIDITKVDSGYLKLELKNGDIISTLENITMSIISYAESKQINVIFDTNIEEKIIAYDSDKIERILLNLLSNAIKFTPSKGNIFVSVVDRGENILISVKDTGIGIPEDKQKIIFDRFVQVDKSLSRSCEGSGIGLSLVKSFVNMHQGKIYLKSKYKEGTEFIIELPCKILPCDNNENKELLNYETNTSRIDIEFSDIY